MSKDLYVILKKDNCGLLKSEDYIPASAEEILAQPVVRQQIETLQQIITRLESQVAFLDGRISVLQESIYTRLGQEITPGAGTLDW